LPYDFKRVLLDDSTASVTDIEVFPACYWLHFLACLIARLETVRDRHIAANANPSLGITRFVCDEFFRHS
jgi:hypothetical protein